MDTSSNDRAARALPMPDFDLERDVLIPLSDFEFDVSDDQVEARWSRESLTMNFPPPAAPTNLVSAPDPQCIRCQVEDAITLSQEEHRRFFSGDQTGPEISGCLDTDDLVLVNRALVDAACICDPSPTAACTPECPVC